VFAETLPGIEDEFVGCVLSEQWRRQRVVEGFTFEVVQRPPDQCQCVRRIPAELCDERARSRIQ